MDETDSSGKTESSDVETEADEGDEADEDENDYLWVQPPFASIDQILLDPDSPWSPALLLLVVIYERKRDVSVSRPVRSTCVESVQALLSYAIIRCFLRQAL